MLLITPAFILSWHINMAAVKKVYRQNVFSSLDLFFCKSIWVKPRKCLKGRRRKSLVLDDAKIATRMWPSILAAFQMENTVGRRTGGLFTPQIWKLTTPPPQCFISVLQTSFLSSALLQFYFWMKCPIMLACASNVTCKSSREHKSRW